MVQIPLTSTLYTMTDLNDRVGVPADEDDGQSVTGGVGSRSGRSRGHVAPTCVAGLRSVVCSNTF